MIDRLISLFKNHVQARDFVYAITFGLLSTLLGYIQFLIPGIEGAQSDFREIPLLISVFYIHNPLFLLISSSITAISTSAGGSYLTTIVMHFAGLIFAWMIYHKFCKSLWPGFTNSLIWVLSTIIYYACLLVPIMIGSYILLDLGIQGSFIESYFSTMGGLTFEIFTTSLVTVLYLVQMKIRHELERQNKNLEIIVKERTLDLETINEDILSNNVSLEDRNKQIEELNKSLDDLAKARSIKIQKQLEQLLRYSQMNSQDVRAPLARILGLVNLLKVDTDKRNEADLYSRIKMATEDLDAVVRKMNQVLEEDLLVSE